MEKHCSLGFQAIFCQQKGPLPGMPQVGAHRLDIPPPFLIGFQYILKGFLYKSKYCFVIKPIIYKFHIKPFYVGPILGRPGQPVRFFQNPGTRPSASGACGLASSCWLVGWLAGCLDRFPLL